MSLQWGSLCKVDILHPSIELKANTSAFFFSQITNNSSTHSQSSPIQEKLSLSWSNAPANLREMTAT